MLKLALAALTLPALLLDSGRWGQIGQFNGSRLYVETSSIAGEPTQREIKLLIVSPRAEPNGYRATLAWLILDCPADAGRIYEVQERSQSGQLMGRSMPGGPATPNVAGSPRAQAASVACGRASWTGELMTMQEVFTR